MAINCRPSRPKRWIVIFRTASCELPAAKNQSGQILILALGITSVMLILTIFVLTLGQRSAQGSQRSAQIVQAKQLAEAGIDRAFEQLARDSQWAGEADTPLGPGTFTVTVSDTNPPDPARKLITATGAVPARIADATTTTISVEASGSSAGGSLSFSFAVQADTGGIEMHQGARIRGNVWSNGPITGLSSAQNQIITGGATVAGPSGLIDRVFAYGTVLANQVHRTITNSDATADILTNSQFRLGTGYWEDSQAGNQGALVHQAVTPPDPEPLPITDAIVDDIRATFAGAPTHTGDYNVPGYIPTSLGPLTITGNLDLAVGANLTLTGNVRVLGNITMRNSASLQADPAAFAGGQESAVFMAEGNIVAHQGARFVGSVVILGLAATGNFDLDVSVRGDNILFAATPHGNTDLRQGVVIRQISANRIILRNSAEIPTFPSSITLSYGGGGAGTWRYAPGTWREILD